MPARVTLSITQGDNAGQTFSFDQRTTCIAGRHRTCNIRILEKDSPRKVSSRHFFLDINPPDVRIRDLYSRNGTFVNGKCIGKRNTDRRVEENAAPLREVDLQDGDEIRVRSTVLRVAVHVPIRCDRCAAEIPDDDADLSHFENGLHVCAGCRQLEVTAQRPAPAPLRKKTCASCGCDVSGEIGEHRFGQYVCRACRKDPFARLKVLLESAKSGQPELASIRGYEIVKKLGQGGFGIVCLARREKTNEQVALKLMLPDVAADPRAIDDFTREMRNAQALKHPHVVRLHEAGTCDGTFFMTLDFCNSGSVDRLLDSRRGKRAALGEAVPIVLDALDGLAYAHQVQVPVLTKNGSTVMKRGLVHRDIKPHNIFLHTTRDRRLAKIGDYGFSKAFDAAGLTEHTCAGFTAGTPAFICRQQVLNFRDSRPEVDVWAMAATLYNLLTGETVRDFSAAQKSGSDRLDVWQIVLQSPVVPIRQRLPGVPPRLAELLDTALDDREELHFKTALDFKRALLEAL